MQVLQCQCGAKRFVERILPSLFRVSVPVYLYTSLNDVTCTAKQCNFLAVVMSIVELRAASGTCYRPQDNTVQLRQMPIPEIDDVGRNERCSWPIPHQNVEKKHASSPTLPLVIRTPR